MQTVPIAQFTAASAAQVQRLPASVTLSSGQVVSRVARLKISPAAGNASFISVLDFGTGDVLQDLWPPSGGQGDVASFSLEDEEHGIQLVDFAVQFAHAGDKWDIFAAIE